MHRRLAELLEYAAAQRAGLLEAVESVPEPLRDRRAAEDCWSVAEVLEHLYRSEGRVVAIVNARLAEARAAGLEEESETGSLLGSLDPFRIPLAGRRVPAPASLVPTGMIGWAEGLSRLEGSRAALLDAIIPGNGLALGQVLHRHPILGPLSLYQWILFVGQHEARHAAQIRAAAGGGA